MKSILTFPEPRWKPIPESDILYFKDRFVDSTPWQLLVAYWGITVGGFRCVGRQRLQYERQPVYAHYHKKDIKQLCRDYIKRNKGGVK